MVELNMSYDAYIQRRVREAESLIVWIGSTIHGLDDAYGPFDTIEEIDAWLESQPEPPSKDQVFILCLQKAEGNLFA